MAGERKDPGRPQRLAGARSSPGLTKAPGDRGAKRAPEPLSPRSFTAADLFLWLGILVVALAGATLLFGGTVRDLVSGGESALPAAASARTSPTPH